MYHQLSDWMSLFNACSGFCGKGSLGHICCAFQHASQSSNKFHRCFQGILLLLFFIIASYDEVLSCNGPPISFQISMDVPPCVTQLTRTPLIFCWEGQRYAITPGNFGYYVISTSFWEHDNNSITMTTTDLALVAWISQLPQLSYAIDTLSFVVPI